MRVGVLGGGLQGACVALELARRGVAVDLFERAEQCLSRASLQNEGKIHLGYVYANDTTRETARLMIKGALCFQTLMRRWIGPAIDEVPVSAPFYYLVHRESILPVSEVEEHFARTREIILEESEGMPCQYFGADYREAPAAISAAEADRHFAREAALAVYRTPEIAIESQVLARLVQAQLAREKNIRCRCSTEIRAVHPAAGEVEVEFESNGEKASRKFDHVVNTLWESRLAIDQTAGVTAPRPWLFRIKHFLRMNLPENGLTLPTTTIVLGPFGDIVRYANDQVFLSWYPVGMTGVSAEITPPAWPTSLDREAAAEIRAKTLAGLAAVIPAVNKLSPAAIESCRLFAGVIFAWGETDIPDRTSGLHQRSAVGPTSYGRYHTIDTGKLTMAPFFGKMMVDRILEKNRDAG